MGSGRRSTAAPLAVAIVIAASATPVRAGDPVAGAIHEHIARLVSGAGLVIAGEPISSRILLPDLYRKREFRAAWAETRNVDDMLHAIRGMEADGLRPIDYHLQAIDELRRRPTDSPAVRADLDLLLSDALIRLAYHLQFGKVDPEGLDPHWNMARTIGAEPALMALQDALDGRTIPRAIDRLRPTHSHYRSLARVLATYRAIAERRGWPIIQPGPAIRDGDRDPRVAVLRDRLRVTGDFAGPTPDDSLLFDGSVAEAVRRFQYRAFLRPDGVVGAGTTAAMNVSVKQRIDQIRVDLERARWVMHDLPDRFVLVNVSSSNVYLMEGDSIAWRARCQVGQVARKTPVFRGDMTYLVFNPTWTVPRGILVRDIFPAGRRGEPILQRKKLNAIDGKGRVVSPTSVRWPAGPKDPFPYTLRQDPGPDNALGRVKFMFPNRHAVYLHDTPSKDLFEHTRRTFSSGCIRVERPFELAERLLGDSVRYDQRAMREVVEAGRTRNVSLPAAIPVLVLYWTVSVDRQGLARFSDDVYARDAPVLRALDEPFRFRRRAVLEGR